MRKVFFFLSSASIDLYVGLGCFSTLLHFSLSVNKYTHSFINSANILSAYSQPGIVLGIVNTVMAKINDLPILMQFVWSGRNIK